MGDICMNEDKKDATKGALIVLFMVTMIDLIGFGIVIPFLTYLVEDLAAEQGNSRGRIMGWYTNDFILSCSIFVFTNLGLYF